MAVDSDIQRGLQILQQLNSRSQPMPIQSEADPEIERGLSILNQLKQTPAPLPNPDEYTYGERAMQVPHGFAQGAGTIADIASKYYMAPMARSMEQEQFETLGLPYNQEEGAEKFRALSQPKVEKTLTSGVNKLAGRELAPKEGDTIGQILNTTGQLLVPVPGSGYLGAAKAAPTLGKAAINIGGNLLKKELPMAVGSATALHATPQLAEEGTVGRAAEDLTKMIVGGKAGTSAAKGTANLLKGKMPGKETFQKGAAKLMSYGTNPEKEVLDIAKKHGIELPHNIGTGKGAGSSIQNFLANNYLSKSIFSSGKYKKVYQNADEALMEKLRGSIGTLGKSELKPSEASGQFKHYAKGEESRTQKLASKFYDDAASKLGESDKIRPIHTEKTIASIEKKINKPIRSSADKEVAKHIATLAEDWKITKNGKKEGIFEPGDLKRWEDEQYSRENLREMFGKLKEGAHEIPAEEFIKAIQGINGVLGTRDAVGVTNFLNGLKGAISKDLDSLPNKDFLESYKKAKDFYRENIGERFRSKEARSVLRDEGAIDAYAKLNSVNGINELEKMAGKTELGIQNLNALKKIKAEEIFGKAVEGSLENGKLKKDAFAKIFEKGQEGQEVIERLIGKAEYKKLEDISKISRSFSEHGKDMFNSSHTGITLHNLTEANAVLLNSLGALFGYVPVSAALGSTAVVAIPQVLSRIASNPNIVNQARIYALARQKGNEKYAETIMKRLVKMVEKEAKPILLTVSKQSKPKQGEENE